MKAFKAVFIREFNIVFKRKIYVFLLLLWPILYGLLLGSIYSHKVVTKIPMAVLDMDHSMLSRMTLRYLNSCRSLNITCYAQDMDELKKSVESGKIYAGVVIPKDFEKGIKRSEVQTVTAFVNGSNILIANLMISDIRTAVGTISAGIKLKYLEKTGNTRDRSMALQSPLKTDLMKLYNPGYNYLTYLVPGLWFTIIQQIILLFAAMMISREFEKKSIKDFARAAGHNPFAAAAGKTALYFLVSYAVCIFYLGVMFPSFDMPVKGNIMALLVLSAIFVLSVISFGFLISAALRSRNDCLKAALLVSAPALILSGYMWPIHSMPHYLQPIVYVIPLTVFLRGFLKIFQLGMGLTDIYREILFLLIQSSVYFTAGMLFLKRDFKEHKDVL